MSFTVVNGRDDHEFEDAVRRGVADGLARLLEVPRHPNSVQELLDKGARIESKSPKPPEPPASSD
jgi:hypothetical protein